MSTLRVCGSALLCVLSLLGAMGSGAGELEDRFDGQLTLAREGNAQAMYEVGQMYELGMGTSASRADAISWYRKAAELGHGPATYQMGYAYYWGKGVTKDRRQAHTWFERAANAGSQAAMPYLSKMYALGQGVPQDKQKAADWAARARTDSNLYRPPPKPEQPKQTDIEPPAAEPKPAASPPHAVAASSSPKPTPKTVAVAAPRPKAVTPKPQPAPKPVRRSPTAADHRNTVLKGDWLKGTRPALYLPSTETACRKEKDVIRCHSAAKRSSLLGRPYEFQIVAALSNFAAKGQFTLSFQPALIQALEAPPGGYAADAEQTLTDDALRERVERQPVALACKLDKPTQITCTDTHGKAIAFTVAGAK